MLVTFRSKAYANVTMFGDVATALLKMMGHSGTVPSALLARDIPPALQQLEQGLAAMPKEQAEWRDKEDKDAEPQVGLKRRAHPLIQLLHASQAQGADVTWEEGAPTPLKP
jgi:hypothetical protein